MPQIFDEIFQLIWRLSNKIQIIREISSNFCIPLRKPELYDINFYITRYDVSYSFIFFCNGGFFFLLIYLVGLISGLIVVSENQKAMKCGICFLFHTVAKTLYFLYSFNIMRLLMQHWKFVKRSFWNVIFLAPMCIFR